MSNDITAKPGTFVKVPIPVRVLLRGQPSALAVYVAIASYADNATGEAYPSRRALAAEAGVSVRTVDRMVARLVTAGVLTVERRPIPGRRNATNLYRIALSGRVGAARQGDTGDTQWATRVSPELDPGELDPNPFLADVVGEGREPNPKPKARPRDVLWEAIADVCGWAWSDGSLTSSARGRLNKAAKELREVDATPADVTAVAAAYRREWPDATLTPQALTGNWSTLRAATVHAPQLCAVCFRGWGEHDLFCTNRPTEATG